MPWIVNNPPRDIYTACLVHSSYYVQYLLPNAIYDDHSDAWSQRLPFLQYYNVSLCTLPYLATSKKKCKCMYVHVLNHGWKTTNQIAQDQCCMVTHIYICAARLLCQLLVKRLEARLSLHRCHRRSGTHRPSIPWFKTSSNELLNFTTLTTPRVLPRTRTLPHHITFSSRSSSETSSLSVVSDGAIVFAPLSPGPGHSALCACIRWGAVHISTALFPAKKDARHANIVLYINHAFESLRMMSRVACRLSMLRFA